MKKVTFSLAQTNGNVVSFELKDIANDLTQDKFAGTYMFPAMLRLVKGSAKLFDKALPVSLSFMAQFDNDETSTKVVAAITIKSKSVHEVRKAVLCFNEAIAGLVVSDQPTSIYSLLDMKGDKGGEFRRYASRMLRPSIPLNAAISN